MSEAAPTIPAVLRQRAASTPDAVFVYFEGETLTYVGADHQSDQVAAGLLAWGITRGDRVAIAATNSPKWLLLYLATAKIGAVLVTLNVAYREREFTYMLGHSGARLLVCDAEDGDFQFTAFMDALRPEIPTVEEVIFLGGDEVGWQSLITTDPTHVGLPEAEAQVRASDPAIILYTSGTTGVPKGATLTQASLLASAAAQVERLEQTPSDVILGVLPFNHVGGLTCTLTSSLVAGGGFSLLPRFHPDLVRRAMQETPISMFVGVPTMFRMVLASGAPEGADGIRLCVVGGSNLEPALAEQVTSTFDNARMANLYGLSETSGACAISPPGDSVEMVGRSIGTMLGDFEGRIVDDEHEPLPPGEVGELQVRGGCVAAGYWEMPDETASAFGEDGWLSTGDVGSMTEDGHVMLVARKKEMYVRGGYNVYPAEVENVLATHPSVAMSAVIGTPDDTFGETGLAFVVPAADQTVDASELIELCRRTLAAYKVPSRIEVVESLPMTPAGKIRKVALKQP
ncbi:class I adenylate-forming enzyme family protein [Janibacter alittae]|uniref:Class I adenylate-forming enzyme family protein n=1 Tax=Janibacter alittae TaxID=3115209 RepID=A0ABZ2MKU8_9MICO